MKHADRPNDLPLEALRTVPSGFIADALHRLDLQGALRPLNVSKSDLDRCIVGPAVTIRFAPIRGKGNSKPTLYEILRTIPPDSIVVISASYTEGYLLGANVCTAALQARARALLIDGCIRDLSDIERLDLAVFFRSTNVVSASQSEILAVNTPVICAGAQVRAGDIVAVDRDGGLVIPPEYLAAVVENIREIERLEEEQGEIIASGGALEDLERILRAKKQRRPL